MKKVSQLAARGFLGHIFLLAGISKIGAYKGLQGYMDVMGVPDGFLLLAVHGVGAYSLDNRRNTANQ